MKPWCLLAWLPLLAWGQDVSLVFDGVPLRELARVAYGEIERRPLILAPEMVESDAAASLILRGVSSAVAVESVGELLRRAGFQVQRRGPVVWVEKAAKAEDEDFVYRPRFRSVGYLVDMVGGLFKGGVFTHQRGLPNALAMPPPIDGPMAREPAQKRPVADSGTSAFSKVDKEAEALVFRGAGADVRRLQAMLVQLDRPVPELLVRAVVFEVSRQEFDQSAVSLAASLVGGRLGLNLGVSPGLDYSGVFKVGGLSVVLDALASDRRFKVVSSPTLRVKSGASARLTVGSDTPVLGNAQLDRNGNPVQAVEYKPSGVILDLRPEVREDVADLQITQQLSNFIATTTGVNNSPTLIKRELTTSVGVKGGEVLMLGGLDEEKTSEGRAGLSFLPAWFGSRGVDASRSEVLLVLEVQRI